MAAKHGLGRGLEALIKDGTASDDGKSPAPGLQTLPLKSIKKAPSQPRREFDEEALLELTQSITEHGVLQPLLVRKQGTSYEVMAGERRLRAATRAGLAEVPVVILEADDRNAFQIALIENLQREDLTILEEAEGYRVLMKKFEMTQEGVAQHVGKARATVANALRLLDLPEEIQAMLGDRRISTGHAKILSGLDTEAERLHFAERTIKEGLSVRNLEKAVNQGRRVPRKPRATRPDIPATHLSHLSDKLHQFFGTRVRLTPSRTFANGKKGKGSLEIDFFSNEDLDRILSLLGLSDD